MPLQTFKAKRLIDCHAIIWDEAPMAPKNALNAIDKLLRKLMGNEIPFGGKVIILGGDFRQVTPVIPKGNKAKIIENSIKNRVRDVFQTLKLTINMRAHVDEKEFAEWLLKVGNGQEKLFTELGEDLIKVPDECVVSGDIIDDLYSGITNVEDLKDICCLSTKNEFVDELNIRIQNQIVSGPIFSKIR